MHYYLLQFHVFASIVNLATTIILTFIYIRLYTDIFVHVIVMFYIPMTLFIIQWDQKINNLRISSDMELCFNILLLFHIQ